MLLSKRAQSTAEYAILIALVAAVVGGVLQVTLKGAIREKNKQAVGYMMNQGGTAFNSTATTPIFTQSSSLTTVKGGDANFLNEKVIKKGGVVKQHNIQTTGTSAAEVETTTANQL